jgi:hypothetical protein
MGNVKGLVIYNVTSGEPPVMPVRRKDTIPVESRDSAQIPHGFRCVVSGIEIGISGLQKK